MKIIGLTGGIASGKSTARNMLEERGACVLDADAVYHRLIAPVEGEPSPLARQIEARFPGVLSPDGRIDRRALGRRVFADTTERRALEAITHPAVAHAAGQRLEQMRRDGCHLAIYDVPLLYERGLDGGMDAVIVVWVPREVQVSRLAKRDGLPPRVAEQRLASQLPLDEKRRRADWVVDNSGDLSATRQQIDRIWEAITI